MMIGCSAVIPVEKILLGFCQAFSLPGKRIPKTFSTGVIVTQCAHFPLFFSAFLRIFFYACNMSAYRRRLVQHGRPVRKGVLEKRVKWNALTPMEKRPPGTSIGRYSVEPTVTCLVSIFPCPLLSIRSQRHRGTYSSIIRRDRREGARLPTRNAYFARERAQRHADPARLVEPRALRVLVEAPHLQRRLGELVGKQAKAGDEAGPAPRGGREREDVDLQGVPGLRARDEDGAVDLVERREVERAERGRRGVGDDLAVARVETVKGDGVARLDGDDGGDAALALRVMSDVAGPRTCCPRRGAPGRASLRVSTWWLRRGGFRSGWRGPHPGLTPRATAVAR